MKLFVIFFCMVIGYACVDLQRVEIGEDDLKSNKNARKVDSLAANETTNEDQHIRSEDVPAPALSVDKSSKETEASEKPSSAVTPMTVTSEVKKSGQRAYLGAREIDLWSLLKHSHRHISANRYSIKARRSFLGTSAAIRDIGKDIAIKTRTKRNNVGEDSHEKAREFKIYQLRDMSPPKVKAQVAICTELDDQLVKSLAKTGTVPTDLLDKYKAAKTEERKMVKDLKDGIGSHPWVYPPDYSITYKGWEKDAAEGHAHWDFFDIRKNNTAFFDAPSPALDKYMAMKRKEYQTLDSLFGGEGPKSQGAPSAGPDVYEGQTGNEFEGGAIENSAKADFECPKKKRESGSQASQMHTQVFVIFLCMVIGIFIVDQQQLEIGEDDLKANENASEAKRSFPRKDQIRSAEKIFHCSSL